MPQDPDLRREVQKPEEMVEVLLDFYQYFSDSDLRPSGAPCR